MAFITCRDVSLACGGRVAVSGLNFEVRSGDFLCVVGENGSGKNTLLKELPGLISPWQGSVSTSDGLKHRDIGYPPQQTSAQKDFHTSAYEAVLSGRLNSRGILPFYSRADKQVALENMRRLDI